MRFIPVTLPAPGLGMSDRTTPERDPLRTTFHTLTLALECARDAKPLITRLRRTNKEIASQLERALIRACLGIGEANKREGGNKALRFRTARGEANEALVDVDVIDFVDGRRGRWPRDARRAHAARDEARQAGRLPRQAREVEAADPDGSRIPPELEPDPVPDPVLELDPVPELEPDRELEPDPNRSPRPRHGLTPELKRSA